MSVTTIGGGERGGSADGGRRRGFSLLSFLRSFIPILGRRFDDDDFTRAAFGEGGGKEACHEPLKGRRQRDRQGDGRREKVSGHGPSDGSTSLRLLAFIREPR